MFAGIPVKGENGVGFARAVSSLLPLSWHQMRNRMRSRPGEGRQCVRHARYRRYQPDSFLFPLSRAPGDKTPDHPRRYLLHRFTTIRPRTTTPIRPQFLSLRPRNLAPLLFFLFFFFLPPVCVEQPSMNRRWDCIGVFWLDCHRVCSMDFLFFFSFLFLPDFLDLSLFTSLFVFFWTTWRGHLKKWHRYSLHGTSSIMFLRFIFFFFFF